MTTHVAATVLAAEGSATTSTFFFLAILTVPVLLIFFQRRAMKRQTTAVQTQLRPGLEVMTGGGLYGTVRALRDDVVELEVSPGTIQRWDRRAIARIVTIDEPADALDQDPRDDA